MKSLSNKTVLSIQRLLTPEVIEAISLLIAGVVIALVAFSVTQ